MRKNHWLRLTMTALLTALIMLLTAYVLHIPIGVNNGYIHLGDTMIYLSAVLLPTPIAVLSAAVGGVAFCLLATALDRVNFKNRIQQML